MYKFTKTAMFGLCRALKKQSGGLFLVSRHSEASKGANGSFKATRAAMFGLDARIALAIFGALSVISGAALYSAIQDAKVTGIIADMNEMGKAYEQYYLDTGTTLVKSDTINMKARDLVIDPGVSGWNGPYVSYTANTNLLNYSKISSGIIYFTRLKSADFTNAATTSGACTDVAECDLYVSIREPIAANHLRALGSEISQRVDGDSNMQSGRVRSIENATYYYLYFKYMPAQSL